MLAELARAVTNVSAIDSERKVPLLHRTLALSISLFRALESSARAATSKYATL